MKPFLIYFFLTFYISNASGQEYFAKTYSYPDFANSLTVGNFSLKKDTLVVCVIHKCPHMDSTCTNIMLIDPLGFVLDTTLLVMETGKKDVMIFEKDRIVFSGRKPSNQYLSMKNAILSTELTEKIYSETFLDNYFKILNQGLLKHNDKYYTYGTYRSHDSPTEVSAFIINWNTNLDTVINNLEIKNNAKESHVFDLQNTPDGNLAYLNYVENHNTLQEVWKDNHYFIRKMDEDGNLLGEFYHGESNSQSFFPSMLAHSNGSYYFSSVLGKGLTFRERADHGMIHKVKADLSEFDWSRYFPLKTGVGGDPKTYDALDFAECANGDILVGGVIRDNYDTVVLASAFLMRIDSDNGDVLWKRTYLFPVESDEVDLPGAPYRYTYLKQVKEAPNGDIVAMGDHRRFMPDFDYWDMLLIKMNAEGCIDGEECQDIIIVDGEVKYTEQPEFIIGAKWTYEFFPESEDPNEIIHSYIEYEIIDTFTRNDSTVYLISNNRGLDEEWMYQDATKISFWDQDLQEWQLTYKFETTVSFTTPYVAEDGRHDALIELDTVRYRQFNVGERAQARLQDFTIKDNGLALDSTGFQVVNRIGKLVGGLRLGLGEEEKDYKIGNIRCFEQGDFSFNFDMLPLPWGIACDSVYIEVIDGLDPPIVLSEIKVYPNPTNDIINIEGSHLFSNYRLYDALGRSIQSGKSTNKIDMRAMQQGLYFLDLYSEGKEKVRFKVSKL